MSIKETMISAALINTALLFTLFLTAAGGQHDTVQAGALDRFTATDTQKSFYTHAQPKQETSTLPIAESVDNARSTRPALEGSSSSIAQKSQELQKPQEIHAQSAISSKSEGNIQDKPLVQTTEHVVQKGERLEQIARRYGMTIEQLVALNELSSTQLKIGQMLRLSRNTQDKANTSNTHAAAASDKSQTAAASGKSQEEKKQSSIVYHYVEAGENPWTIARKHKISLQRLLDLNNLDQKSAKKIKTGSRLRVQ